MVASASAPVAEIEMSISSWSSSSRMLYCSAGLSSTTKSRLRRGVEKSLMRARAESRPSGVAGFVNCQYLDRDMPSGRILFQMAEHGPAQHVRQEHVERDGRRVELTGEGQGFCATRSHENLESLVVG